ncbi:IPT/TIG domain-containing protein, partial [Streptomyces sioyaensis]|uniref:IPT/TIG domain-containing protein n=1 Tax=Streptomyces sioyaensis TaxID=67364 RepID=UPI00340DFC03
VNGAGTVLTGRTPSSTPGSKTVTVTTPGGSAFLPNGYTYVLPAPTISSISPTTGTTAGHTFFTIQGTGLSGATSVTFDGDFATQVTVNGAGTVLTGRTPSSTPGSKTVTVTTPGGSASLSNGYTYVVPAFIALIVPAVGLAAGGTPVTITGSGFTGASSVTFDGTPALTYVVVTDFEIAATTPPGSGTVDVTVTTGAGPTTAPNSYTYL